MVWEAPQPAEKAVNMMIAATHVGLRPRRSLSLAQITNPATSSKCGVVSDMNFQKPQLDDQAVSLNHNGDAKNVFLTNVCDQVCCY